MTATPSPTGYDPVREDGHVWYREDRVLTAMQCALNEAVETHGSEAKGIAWDVRSAFTKLLASQ